MTALRTAAQQALEALELHAKQYPHMQKGYTVDAITALRAALAEPENWELRRLREELERCKQTCAATSEAWRQEAALAEPVQEPYCFVYEYDGAFGLHREFYPKDYNGHKPDRKVALYTAPPQRKPLTDDEIHDCWQQRHRDKTTERRLITRAIERAHGIT